MNIEMITRPVTEARLSSVQVKELTAASSGSAPQVVLQAEGLGAPQQWSSQLPTAAERIVIEYGTARRRFERTWALSSESRGTRYYTLVDDTFASGYVSH